MQPRSVLFDQLLDRTRLVLVWLLAFPLFSVYCNAQSQVTVEKQLAEEATLHAVQFVDADYGWAVGDRGTLLRTTDGGRRWQRITLPVSCSFYDLSFIDKERGWIVGGRVTGYTHRSVGVVLQTKDGGKTWQQANKGEVARLREVQFFSRRRGYAVGDSTPLNPSGLYETTDGGRGWNPLVSSEPISWQTASFTQDGTYGILASSRGMVRRLSGPEAVPTGFQPRREGIHDTELIDRTRGWLVGDGGLLLTTNDQGRHWRLPPNSPGEQFTDWFDWFAVEAIGSEIWIAGAPGSLVLYSPDQGISWHAQPTGITTPIRDIHFINGQNGWAVGSFGSILSTSNGGKTWRSQRGGNRQAGLSLLSSSPKQLAAEVVTSQTVGHGYRGVLYNTNLPTDTLGQCSHVAKIREASFAMGCSDTDFDWRFTSTTNKEADLKAISRGIAKHLLTYRPLAMVTSEDEPNVQFRQAIDRAIELARKNLPAELGLPPWQPSYRIHVRDNNSPRTSQVDRNLTVRKIFKIHDYQSELGDSPSHVADHAWSFVSDIHHQSPLEYQCLFTNETVYSSTTTAHSDRSDLLANLGVARDGITRRKPTVPPTSRLNQMRRLAQKRNEFERLLSVSTKTSEWANQVINLTGGLDTEAGVRQLSQLAEGYRKLGRTDLAADTYYLLARRYIDHPRAEASLVWLIEHYASAENANWLLTKQRTTPFQQRTLMNFPSLQTKSAKKHLNDLDNPVTPEEYWDRSLRLIEYLKTALPSLYAEPEIRFAELAILRSQGKHQEADILAQVLSKQTLDPAWLEAAITETWLTYRKEGKPQKTPPPMPLAQSVRVTSRPLLDGNLDEPIWVQSKPITLSALSNQKGTQISFAHDDEFLFVAIHVPNAQIPQATIDQSTPRQRDTKLDSYDRIQLTIDTDRDYRSSYELVIDQRGWTRDHLNSLRQWQPSWFVANGSDDSIWTAEIAIPIEELLPERPSSSTAWALSVERFKPNNRSSEKWSQRSANKKSPRAYGILLFD